MRANVRCSVRAIVCELKKLERENTYVNKYEDETSKPRKYDDENKTRKYDDEDAKTL